MPSAQTAEGLPSKKFFDSLILVCRHGKIQNVFNSKTHIQQMLDSAFFRQFCNFNLTAYLGPLSHRGSRCECLNFPTFSGWDKLSTESLILAQNERWRRG